MKINKFNDMKAYLVKPNRLFTSRPPNTIGGGAIEGEDLGSRTGFNEPKKKPTDYKYSGVQEHLSGPNKGKFYFKKRNPNWVKGSGEPTMLTVTKNTKTQAEKAYAERQKKMGDIKTSNVIGLKNNHAEKINNFVDNFIDKNISKYGIRDYDIFKSDLTEAFKKSGIKDIPGRKANYKDFPNIGATDSGKPFSKFDLKPITRGTQTELTENYFKKLFYSGKLQTDDVLRNSIDRYLDYNNIDKKYYKGTKLDREALRKQYADVLDPKVNSDILFMMESDNVGTPKFRSGILKNVFGDKQQKYIDKKNISSVQYEKHMSTIENFLSEDELKKVLNNETSIKKFMRNQTDLLNNIFDTSELKKAGYGELIFNADHLEGIAEIARMDNAEDMMRGLKNLMGTTAERNMQLGLRGFSTKRRNLIDKIQKGYNIDANTEELNKITKEAYPQLQGDLVKYDPKTKSIIPTKNFTMEYDPETAFRQYFTELSTNPIGAQELVKQAQTSKKLTQTLIKDSSVYENIVGNLQKILLEKGDISQKELSSLLGNYKKEKQQTLQLFGKLFCGAKFSNGGRVNLAEGSANICSTDEMLSNMKKDKAISQGADKAEAAKAKARLLQAGKSFGKILGTVVAPADIAIELAFAGPALLRGDLQGAINATTYGFLGGGTSGMEQIKEKFGTDSTEYALYGTEEAIKDKMTSINELDKIVERGQQLGITESKTGEQVSNLGGARQEFAKNEFVKDFILASDTDKKVTQNFEKFYPLTTDKQKNIKALQNIANFSDAEQSLAPELDSDTVEGTIKGAGGYFKKEMAPRFDLPQYQENINRLKELRIGDFSPKAGSEIPDYEKKQVDQGIKNYISQYGAEAAREQFESQGIDIQPYLKEIRESYGNRLGIDPVFMKDGGRINFADGGRLSFAEGPEDPSKRKFLKKTAIGGGILGGITTGLVNLMDLFKGGAKEGIVAAKAAESEAQKIFFDLVSAVRNKGVLKQLDEASETSRGVTAYEYKGVKVAEDELGISVEFTTDQGAPAVVEYKKPTYDVDPETGTSFKVAGEFEEGQQVGRYGYDGNVDLDFEAEIMDDIEDVKKVIDD